MKSPMAPASENDDVISSNESFEALLIHDRAEELLDSDRAKAFIKRQLPEVNALLGFHEDFSGVHKDLWSHTLQVVGAMPSKVELRWAALLHDIGKIPTRELKENGKVTFWHHEKIGAELTRSIGQRLGWSQAKNTHIAFVVENHGRFNSYQETWTDKAIRRLIRDSGPYLKDLLIFSSGDLTTQNSRKVRRAKREDASLRRRIERLSAVEPKLPRGLGEEVIKAFNLERGPQVRAAMNWLKSEVQSERLSPHLNACDYVEALSLARGSWESTNKNSS